MRSLDLIREALSEVAPKRTFDDLQADTVIDNLGLDSITLLEMVGELEDRLEVTFDEDELAKLETIGDLAKLLERSSA